MHIEVLHLAFMFFNCSCLNSKWQSIKPKNVVIMMMTLFKDIFLAL